MVLQVADMKRINSSHITAVQEFEEPIYDEYLKRDDRWYGRIVRKSSSKYDEHELTEDIGDLEKSYKYHKKMAAVMKELLDKVT